MGRWTTLTFTTPEVVAGTPLEYDASLPASVIDFHSITIVASVPRGAAVVEFYPTAARNTDPVYSTGSFVTSFTDPRAPVGTPAEQLYPWNLEYSDDDVGAQLHLTIWSSQTKTLTFTIEYELPAYINNSLFFDVGAYGAVGDGSADDTDSFGLAAAALQAAGGGVLWLHPGCTYKVSPSVGDKICTFDTITGLTIEGNGALINDVTSYGASDLATLFDITDCVDIRVSGLRVASQRVTTGLNGLAACKFNDSCRNIDVQGDFDGCNSGFWFITDRYATPTTKASNIRVKLYAYKCTYPLKCEFSGDDLTAQVQAINCQRNIFVMGVNHQRLSVHSTNQQGATEIAAYTGYGCTDISLDYYDRETTDTVVSGQPQIILQFSDTAAATMKDIRIRLDMKCPNVANPWGEALCIYKTDGIGGADTTGRGHIIDGFELSGIHEQLNGWRNHIAQVGAFASPDVIKNVRLHDLSLTGTGAGFTFTMPVLSDLASVMNCHCDGILYLANASGGTVVYIGSSATSFTSANSDTDVHCYAFCTVSTPGQQGLTNKSIISTNINSLFAASLPMVATYANNAAAVSAGLPLGAVYRITGSDNLAIVHS